MLAIHAGTMQVNGTTVDGPADQQTSLLIVDKTPGCEMIL